MEDKKNMNEFEDFDLSSTTSDAVSKPTSKTSKEINTLQESAKRVQEQDFPSVKGINEEKQPKTFKNALTKYQKAYMSDPKKYSWAPVKEKFDAFKLMNVPSFHRGFEEDVDLLNREDRPDKPRDFNEVEFDENIISSNPKYDYPEGLPNTDEARHDYERFSYYEPIYREMKRRHPEITRDEVYAWAQSLLDQTDKDIWARPRDTEEK